MNRRSLFVFSPPKSTSPHLQLYGLPFETNSRLLSSTASAKMPLYNVSKLNHQKILLWAVVLTQVVQVTFKEDANEEELTKAKENAKSSGGEIKHEFTL